MKRKLGMIIALVTLLAMAPAYAAGGLNVTEETWYVAPRSGDYRVYLYAVVQNTGTEAESVNDLLLEIENRAGTAIESTSKYNLYPSVLQPGEIGYLTITVDVKDIERKSEIDHYTLTITSKFNDDKTAVLLEADAEYLEEDEDENEDVLRATVTNTGSDNAFAITAVMAARDAEGKLLCVTSAASKDIGLGEGASFLARTTVPADIVDALSDAGTQIANVDVLAYTIEDVDD